MASLKTIRALVARAVERVLETHVLFPLFAILMLGMIWGATFHLIQVEQEATARAATDSGTDLIETYEAQMMRNLGTIDRTLKTVKYAYELKRQASVLPELRENDLLPPALVFTVSIADRNGNIIASTRPGELRSIADQPYFQSHRLRQGGMQVGFPARSIGKEEWRLQFSRRLNTPDQAFDGVAVVSVEPGYFTSGYEHARLGRLGVLGLLGADEVFLVRRIGDTVSWGDAGSVVPVALTGVSQTGKRAAGRGAQLNSWDGVRRYTHVRELHGYPLSVLVGLSETEQFEHFEQHKQAHLWRAAAISIILLTIIAAMGGLSWQLAKTRLRTRKDQETYYAASNASLDAFFVLRSLHSRDGAITDFILDDTNSQGARLFGKAKEAIRGKTLCEAFPQSRMNGAFDQFVKVAKTGVVHEFEWENRLPKLRAGWLQCQVVRVADGVVAIVRDITERKRAETLRAEQARVLEMIATGIALDEVLQRVLRLIESQQEGAIGSILLLDEEGGRLRHGAALNLPESYTRAIDGLVVGPHAGCCGTAVHRRKTVVVADIGVDPLWEDYAGLAAEHGLRACWSTPILSQNNSVLGTFAMYYREVHEPTVTEMQLVEMAARIAGIAIERKRTEDRIRHMAHHDPLTGLPNRSLLEDRVSQAMLYAQRYHRRVTVVFVDLDNFKLINDSLGHNAGDELLVTVADRMVQSVRSTDSVVRLGGDEFVIVLLDQSDEADAITPTLQKLHDAIAEPLHIAGKEVQVTCSMGLATYPDDGANTETLLMNADAAMYRAKELGRNNYQFYTDEMNTRIHEKLALHEGLRNAIVRGELFLVYQPQVDLRTGRVFGVEALIRWQHPELGVISPMKFIPLAEETGLIVAIGDWVLRTACRQNKAWQDAGLQPVVMSVNVSARQFKEGSLTARIAQILRESGLKPEYLELELTESLIMQDLEQATATMRELQTMGVQLSIDDFGTGYSSLNALKNFPIVRLKLDRSFVHDLPDREDDKAIAMAVISLGHQLRMRVLAEGVETEQQLAFLRENGCDEMQGYHFSKPVLPHELEQLLQGQGQQQQSCIQAGNENPA